MEKDNNRLMQAYVQMIFAYVFSEMEMVEKEVIGENYCVQSRGICFHEFSEKNCFRKNGI